MIFFVVTVTEVLLSLAEDFIPSPIHIHLPSGIPGVFLGVQKKIAFALCHCGAEKNIKGLSKVTRENVKVFGTFKIIYLSCVVLSSAQRLPFHSQSPPAISHYTANKIKLLLLSQSQSGSSAADKDWRRFLTCSLSFGDKVHSFSTTFQIGGNIFLSRFFANFGGFFPSFGANSVWRTCCMRNLTLKYFQSFNSSNGASSL